jgi:8-oxo-dGTP pyrophosphatase MutT (NUDIX family)
MKIRPRRFVRDDDPIVGVGGVVYRRRDDGTIEVLLIRKRDGYWTLPKGKVMPGEPEQEALVREVAEETGLSGVVGAPVRTVSYVTPRRQPARRKVVTFYLFHAQGGELHLSHDEDIVEARWVPLRRSQQRIHRKRLKRVVRQAATLLRDVAATPHRPFPML